MKIGEIEATKGKSGNYYGIDEILGMDIEILEDISSNTEIREYKTKKDNLYYCIKIRHTEEKDLHLTKAALLAVATVLPKTESWNNYKIKINRTGKGFNTAYSVMVLGKGFGASMSMPALSPQEKIVKILKSAPYGLEDKPFWELVASNTNGFPEAMKLVELMKTQGVVVVVNGTWRAT